MKFNVDWKEVEKYQEILGEIIIEGPKEVDPAAVWETDGGHITCAPAATHGDPLKMPTKLLILPTWKNEAVKILRATGQRLDGGVGLDIDVVQT